MKQIESEAYRKVQVIQGKADAEATAIYAQAFNASPEAREFYAFQRAMEVYRGSFQTGTTLVLTTESDLLKPLKGGADSRPRDPKKPQVPAPSAAQTQLTGPVEPSQP